MRVAVTGASGFCGGHVARCLVDAGHEVVGLSRRRSPYPSRHWDAATGAPDLEGTDAVVHLAAAVGDPRPGTEEAVFWATNVDGTRRLLDAAGERPVVVVSSSSVYDTRLDRARVTEAHPTDGGQLNAYGRTKALADRLALEAGAVVVRPRAVYGPGDVHLLPRLLRAVRRGTLSVPGPDVRICVTHVENLGSACVLGLGWAPGAYNVADAEPVSRDQTLPRVVGAALGRPVRIRRVPAGVVNAVADIASAAARVTGREPLLTRYAVDELSTTVVLDTAKARAAGWTPAYGLEDYLATGILGG